MEQGSGEHEVVVVSNDARSQTFALGCADRMRGALGDAVRELHRFHHLSASNPAVGHLVLEQQ